MRVKTVKKKNKIIIFVWKEHTKWNCYTPMFLCGVVWCVYVISFSFLPAKNNLRLNGDRIYIRQTIEETTFRTRSVVVRACVQSCWYRKEKKKITTVTKDTTQRRLKKLSFSVRAFSIFYIYILTIHSASIDWTW